KHRSKSNRETPEFVMMISVPFWYLFPKSLFFYNIRHLGYITAVVPLQHVNEPLYTASGHTFIRIRGKAGNTRSTGKVRIQAATVLECWITQRRVRGKRLL